MRGVDWSAESARLERIEPVERLGWAIDRFGDGTLFTSSFGTGSAVLLHMWSRVARGLPVVFLDTGFHFDETIRYRDLLVARLGLTLEIVRPAQTRAELLAAHGDDFPMRDPDACCTANKVLPLMDHLERARGWVSGLRRDQSGGRAATPILLPTADGPVKVHPIATMTAADVTMYMARHDLPEHPLRARRYLSIGCAPCTRPVAEGEEERAGRWGGTGKTECGLHTVLAAEEVR